VEIAFDPQAMKLATADLAHHLLCNIIELLAEWCKEPPLGPEYQFPAIDDMPAQPEDMV